MRISSYTALSALAAALTMGSALAQSFSGKKVTDIQIKYIGPKTVDEQRIITQMSSAIGSQYNADKLDNDIRTLYKAGLVDNVSIKGSSYNGGVRLTAEVSTRPLLASVGFVGNQKFQDQTLSRKSKLKSGHILGAKDVTAARKFIQEHYNSYDYPDVSISTKIQKTEREGHANLIFTINEGGKNVIHKVKFEGNQAFDHNLLYKEIKSRKKSIFSFITKSGKIDNDQVAEDVESVIDFYKDNGYLKAYSPGAQQIPVKGGKIDLIIPIVEGAKYTVKNVSFGKMTLFTPEQLLPTLVLDPGDPYSQSQMREDIKTIRSYYGSKGYADVRVRPKMINSGANSIHIKYEITEGQRSKVGRINITGNSITKDNVIRREVTLKPGEPFNSVELDTIKNRLKSLNYFDPIYVDDKKSNQANFRDIDIQVAEQKTGSLSFGVGVSSIDSVVGFIGIEQRNFDITNLRTFRGGGQRLNINLRGGSETTDFSVSLVEPWFLGRKLEAGVEAYYKDLLFLSDEYDLTKAGAAVHLRKAVGKKSSVKAELRWESNDVEIESDVAGTGSEFEQFEGEFSRTALTLSYIHDSRNAIVLPRRGHKIDVGLTYSFGDAENTLFFARGSKHWNFKYDIIWTLRGEFTSVDPTSGSDIVPIFDRQFLGGARNLRGFEFNDIGPRDSVTDEVFGGATKFYITSEATFPIADNVRGAIFWDAGSVSEDSWDFDSDLYLDAGLGLRLNLPIGPLALDYAIPIFSPDQQADQGGQFNFYLDYAF